MIIYNVTIIIEESVHEEWLQWMQQKHIPDVMNTGAFKKYRICKLLDSPNEGVTYAIQYFASSIADYEQYKTQHAPDLQKEVMERYKDKFVAYRSLMEIIDPIN